jgi:hypothetical protein
VGGKLVNSISMGGKLVNCRYIYNLNFETTILCKPTNKEKTKIASKKRNKKNQHL